MNKAISFLTLLLLLAMLPACGTQAGTPTVTATPTSLPTPTHIPELQWTLIWSDEFDQTDGSGPDPKNWFHTTGSSGFGNSELQAYTNEIENAYIENGMLVIKAIQEDYLGRDYTSARINTISPNRFTYGRFEVRAKLPNTQGIWPAIWMLPASGSSPVNGEIDIMELIGKEPYRAYATLHYGNPYDNQGGWYDLPDEATFDQDFHVFSIEWEAEEIRWYVDGNQYLKANEWYTSQANQPYPAPFNKPFFFILNVAVGGTWPGSPDESSVFPQSMIVDYVRVYQLK